MSAIINFISKLNDWISSIFCWFVVPMAGILVIEVICRYFFNSPTVWAYPLATIFYAVYMVMGGGYAALTKTHVRMDLFYTKWSDRRKAITDCVTFLVALAFFIPLLYASSKYGLKSLITLETQRGVWEPYTFPWKMAIPIGVISLMLQALAKFLEDIYCVFTGRRFQ